ncbi:MAG: hypothetical protein IKX56_04490, partial [Muribaculaceae bacterium]|nr:hypothetical protein [Muribaculaceae bacterium]
IWHPHSCFTVLRTGNLKKINFKIIICLISRPSGRLNVATSVSGRIALIELIWHPRPFLQTTD